MMLYESGDNQQHFFHYDKEEKRFSLSHIQLYA